MLAVDGLRAAISNYEEKNGLIKDKKATTIEIINKRLKHVMNPITGLDVIKTDLVKKVELADKEIIVNLGIPSNHQFANSLKEDIIEKLETLWDIESVKVEFTE